MLYFFQAGFIPLSELKNKWVSDESTRAKNTNTKPNNLQGHMEQLPNAVQTTPNEIEEAEKPKNGVFKHLGSLPEIKSKVEAVSQTDFRNEDEIFVINNNNNNHTNLPPIMNGNGNKAALDLEPISKKKKNLLHMRRLNRTGPLGSSASSTDSRPYSTRSSVDSLRDSQVIRAYT